MTLEQLKNWAEIEGSTEDGAVGREFDITDPVDRVVLRMLVDVTDRRGWRQEWDQFDEDVQTSIIDDWRELVREELGR